MRINSHAHIFNLNAVFTRTTLEILLRRLGGEGYPPFILTQIQGVLQEAVGSAGAVNPDNAIRGFVSTLRENIDSLGSISLGEKKKLRLLTDDALDALAGSVGDLVDENLLKPFLTRLVEFFTVDAHDFEEQHRLRDIIGFLAIALQPDIGRVARRLMAELPEADDAAVALMMDVTDGTTPDAQLERQAASTSRTILQYPGRIFPFVAVNPLRPRHLEIMKHALAQQGFVGVKLYPSLGYDIDSGPMREVYRWCADHEVPIMAHCNKTGFYATEEDIPRSEPEKWRHILADFRNLKVCFGHFGGDDVMAAQDDLPNDSWTAQICRFMSWHGGVYADVSFHTDCGLGGAQARRYFRNLGRILEDPKLRKRVLFGTDFWLVRQVARDTCIWSYFHDRIPSQHFDAMTTTNPAAFLGLPVGGLQASRAIERHARFVLDHRMEVERPPSDWLRTYVEVLNGGPVDFIVNDLGDEWSRGKEAHARVFMWMRDNQMYSDDARRFRFDDSGRFPVSRLQFWNKGFESGAITARKCEAVARRLHRYFVTNKARLKAGVTQDEAVRQMTGLLDHDATRFTDLGVGVDALYRFKDGA